ncbi:MAG: PQQ-binding-like beta-propeller repeat protein [Verrucomicrobiota bacterium]|nr:PQQ-binding-like beta-propeller repeat protein [Verrucomicrobiota bacterium]
MKFLLVFIGLVLFQNHSLQADWPQWRGESGQGHVLGERVAIKWSEKENVIWKVKTPGRGWSSPVIESGKIWITAAHETLATEEETRERLKANTGSQPLTLLKEAKFHAICVEQETGKIIHDLELFSVSEPQWVHRFNSYASSTPVVEKGKVYCHFGTYGTACVDSQTGKVLWKNLELKCMHENGPGSSPVVIGDHLIFHMDGSDVQYVAALNKNNGSVAWKTFRTGKMHSNPQLKKGYSTPILVLRDGGEEIISPGANWLYSYDSLSGKEKWKVDYETLGFSNVARPVSGDGMVYVATCFMRSQMLGINIKSEPKIVWRYKKGVPNSPSPIYSKGLLYFVGDSGGLVTCLDGKSGKLVWSERIASGKYWAAPFIANGHIYFHNEDGVTTVIREGREFDVISRNVIAGKLMASAAVSDGAIFLRSDDALYKIQE